MRYSSSITMVLAAMSVGNAMAGPAHAHAHRQAHQKKDVDWSTLDWDNMGINWSSAYEAGQATKTAKTTATAAAPTATSTSNSVVEAVESAVSTADDVEDLWEGLVGHSNSRTTFGASTGSSGSAGDNYYGNCGLPYGSNVIKVASREGYSYTNEFINTCGKKITVNIWNKVGSDLQALSGSARAPKDTTLTFVLSPGAKQIVAFAENSQVAWAQAVNSFAESGAFATSWGESNFCSTGSGYDMSAIMNPNGNNYNMTISSVEANCISDMTQNYWLTATEPIGNSDGSCYIAQSTATLTTLMGGTV